MANGTLKEFKDVNDTKHVVDSLKYVLKRPEVIRDPFGPVKYDLYEQIARSYLELLPVVTQRIDAIEHHLEKGQAAGRPFVRPDERPDVAGELIGEVKEGLRLVESRLAEVRQGFERG